MKKTFKTVLSVLTAMTVITGAAGAAGTAVYGADTTTAAQQSESRKLSGTFSGGADYVMDRLGDMLIIKGSGSFNATEFASLIENNSPKDLIILGNNITVPKSGNALNDWICQVTSKDSGMRVSATQGSDMMLRYEETLNYLAAESKSKGENTPRNTFKQKYVLNVLDNEADADTGTFDGGAVYSFNRTLGALVIDGSGSFTEAEFAALSESLSPRIIAFGDEVEVPQSSEQDNRWLRNILSFDSPYTVLATSDSLVKKSYNATIKYLKNVAKEQYGIDLRGLPLDSVYPLYEMESQEELQYRFNMSDTAAEKGDRMEQYLADNGIEQVRARKYAGAYLLGLGERMRDDYASPDGDEVSEEIWENLAKNILGYAKEEQYVVDVATLPPVRIEKINQFCIDNDVTDIDQTQIKIISAALDRRSVVNGYGITFYTDSRDKLHYSESILDLNDVDSVVAYRADRMREVLEDYSSDIDAEVLENVLAAYKEGLTKRIKNGKAQPNGRELDNYYGKNFYEQVCRSAALRGTWVKNGKSEWKSTVDKDMEYLVSDFTIDHDFEKDIMYEGDDGELRYYNDFSLNDGTVHDGLNYHYDPDTKGIYIEGDGCFTRDDGTDLDHTFDIDFYIIGKDVQFEDSTRILKNGTKVNANVWLMEATKLYDHVYIYHNSPAEQEYNTMVESCAKDIWITPENLVSGDVERARAMFPVNYVEDDVDPFDILKGKVEVQSEGVLWGDVNEDGKINIRDAVMIAKKMAEGKAEELPPQADYNNDGVIDVRDADDINKYIVMWLNVRTSRPLKGDVDVNGEIGVGDVVKLSKYLINNNAYRLNSDEAYLNADMNDDGAINGLDNSKLLEVNLHKN